MIMPHQPHVGSSLAGRISYTFDTKYNINSIDHGRGTEPHAPLGCEIQEEHLHSQLRGSKAPMYADGISCSTSMALGLQS